MAINSVFQQIQSSCDFVTNSLRRSSLNYSLQETPFSMYITVRKSFSKQRYPTECDIDFSEDKASVKIKHLKDQRESDSKTIEKYRAQSESDRDTVSILESKVEKAERELYD